MNAKKFRLAIERQIWQRLEKRIKLPAHLPRYLVRQNIVNPSKSLSDLYEFSDDNVESAIAFLLEPRLTKFVIKTKPKNKGKTDDHKNDVKTGRRSS